MIYFNPVDEEEALVPFTAPIERQIITIDNGNITLGMLKCHNKVIFYHIINLSKVPTSYHLAMKNDLNDSLNSIIRKINDSVIECESSITKILDIMKWRKN